MPINEKCLKKKTNEILSTGAFGGAPAFGGTTPPSGGAFGGAPTFGSTSPFAAAASSPVGQAFGSGSGDAQSGGFAKYVLTQADIILINTDPHVIGLIHRVVCAKK